MSENAFEKDYRLYDYDGKKKKKPEEDDDIHKGVLALQQVLNAMDYTQTRQIARQPDKYSEAGLSDLLGKHPSKGKVNAFFLAKAVGLAVAHKKLPQPYKDIFNAFSIIDMGSAIKSNHGIGLDVMRF